MEAPWVLGSAMPGTSGMTSYPHWQTIIKHKVCRNRYFTLREAGMKGVEADDKVFFGDPYSIPSLDEAALESDQADSNSPMMN